MDSCKTVREQFSQFYDGVDDTRVVEAHFEQCSRCQDEYQAYRTDLDLLGGVLKEDSRVVDSWPLPDLEPSAPVVPFYRQPWGVAAMAASLAAVAVLTVFTLQSPNAVPELPVASSPRPAVELALVPASLSAMGSGLASECVEPAPGPGVSQAQNPILHRYRGVLTSAAQLSLTPEGARTVPGGAAPGFTGTQLA